MAMERRVTAVWAIDRRIYFYLLIYVVISVIKHICAFFLSGSSPASVSHNHNQSIT